MDPIIRAKRRAVTESAAAMAHPPRPALALRLGITGHRAIAPGDVDKLAATLDELFPAIAAKVEAVRGEYPGLFGSEPTVLSLASALAEGTDQIAAEAALRHGFELHAILPFARARYAADFAGDALNGFETLLSRARSVYELPTAGHAGPRAYMLAGEATLAHCDVLIAAWNGQEANGRGGTADVVDVAVRRGIPIIHLAIGAEGEPAILWAGFDDMAPEFLQLEDAPRRPLTDASLQQLIEAVVAPPEAPELRLFLDEREQRTRWRAEWALMLAATGVQPLRRSTFRSAAYEEPARLDWEAYRAAAAEACGVAPQMARLEAAFAWADGLAQHYATVFRSGVVLNFAGASLAVLLSLLALLMPDHKLGLLLAELLIIAAVVANTAYGTRREWHRRWLDYRFLAEQLRPLRSLKLLGASNIAGSGGQRWTSWYAQTLWRSLDASPTLEDRGTVKALARHIAAHELDGQIAYNRASAHRMHLLDHRLHRIGLTLFLATILLGLGTLIGLVFAFHEIKHIAPVLGILSAALPTLGAGIFGIRGAGDFAGTAGRSAETARRLAHAAALLRRDDIEYSTVVRVAEQAASIMLADLGEWRSTYTHRKLAIPS